MMYTKEYSIELEGKKLCLRNAQEADAEMLIDFLKQTCEETRFLIKGREEVTLTVEEEKSFIKSQNESNENVMLLGFLDGQYVGNCSLMSNRLNRCRHRASLGIALFQKYTGMGIGRKMIEILFEIAKEQGFEQIELEVVADNKRAIALYKKMGFEIRGTFPRHIKYNDGTYADVYWMIKLF